MKEFVTYLKQVSPIGEESCNAFVSKCKVFSFSKGEFLLKSGQVSQYLYFVKSGIGKVYYLKEDGKEIIDWISDEGNLLTSVSSFLTQSPSLHNCINRIPLGDLASFLGMTQVTLSRVRALK